MKMMVEVKSWLKEAGERVRSALKTPLTVEAKTHRTDLVTNVDKEIETFLVQKIKEHYPHDYIIGEEGISSDQEPTHERFWLIDPIDGTLNFVKQHENFCIMLAFYENDRGKLGFIYNVMTDELFWGGPEIGVYCNEEQVPALAETTLAESLIGMNAYMYRINDWNSHEIIKQSAGIRILGCAGIEYIQILKGQQGAYLSNLAPWDYGAGSILTTALGCKNTQLSGEDLVPFYKERVATICATPQVYQDIMKIISQK